MRKSKRAFNPVPKGLHPCRWLMLFTFTTLLFYTLRAQRGVDYAVHANIIYHFTKYIQWPETSRNGEFVIGIIGESPLNEELKKAIANKTVRNQKIVVKQVSASQSSFDCQILFIAEEESSSLKKLVAKTAGSPVLLVTEEDGLALRGSCINFIIVADRLKLEINKRNLEQRGLSIASELLQLGIVVK